MPVAQALAVKNGRIVEVGGSDEILWLREADYEMIDSDFPCGSNAPLLGISAAVTRKSRRGDVFDGEDAMSAHAALQAYTIDAARAAGTDTANVGAWGLASARIFWSCRPIRSNVGPKILARSRLLQTWVRGVRIFNRP